MAKATKSIFKNQSARLEINLTELFGKQVPNSSDFRQRIGQAIIEQIIARTESGVDVNGNRFKPYSKSYIDSSEFEAFNKSAGEVNLTLAGDMLGLLTILEDTEDRIIIGWDDDTENAKAFNHNTGDTLPRREFLGLSSDEEEIIRDVFADEAAEDDADGIDVETSLMLNESVNTGDTDALNDYLDLLGYDEI